MDGGMDDAQHHENPRHDDEQQVGLARDDRQHDQHVEQHRQFELVAVGIAELRLAFRPSRLAERDIAHLHVAAPDRRGPNPAHPEHQDEGERDLDEEREQDGLEGHGRFSA